jgi:hypothetical protein
VGDQVKKIVEQLFATEDLRAVQSLAVELQCAVYEYIEQLQKKLADSSSARSDDEPLFEIGLSNRSFDSLRSEQTDKES